MKCQLPLFNPSFFMLICLVAVTACIPPRVSNRGYVDAFNRAEKIQPGISTREEVMELLGSPSITNNFGDEIWYYVAKRKEAVAFLKPEITEQKVTRIAFDSRGIVESINGYGLDDKRHIEMVEDVTPTEGHELGVLEQILGNVGRFNNDSRQPGLQGPGGP